MIPNEKELDPEEIDRQLLLSQELFFLEGAIKALFPRAIEIYKDSSNGAPIDSLAEMLKGMIEKEWDKYEIRKGGES